MILATAGQLPRALVAAAMFAAVASGGACGSVAKDDMDPTGGSDQADASPDDPSPATCSDTQSDPFNCGGCGHTCVIPNAEAACDQGSCAIEACDRGFVDHDGDTDNGCELASTCTSGSDCMTECGSLGLTLCDGADAVCTAPVENACNAADDNCDGQCDEGRGGACRTGVHRSSGSGHLYTTDLSRASSAPFNLEAQNYFRVYSQPGPNLQQVFLCAKGGGRHLVTASPNCEGAGNVIEVLGYWSQQQTCGAVPLYRLYHAPSNNHFYTLNPGERDNAVANLGYVVEGIAGYVWTAL